MGRIRFAGVHSTMTDLVHGRQTRTADDGPSIDKHPLSFILLVLSMMRELVHVRHVSAYT